MLSVAFGLGGEVCYSGGADSTIRVWRIPEEGEDDPFGVYGESGHLLDISYYSASGGGCYYESYNYCG